MSIGAALSNALSGLTAASRAAQATSNNLSNALTPGYGRREVNLMARNNGAPGGVAVLGVTRIVVPQIIADRRLARASHGNADTLSAYHQRLEMLVGQPGAAGSLGAGLADLEARLAEAASRPDLPERLRGLSRAADTLAQSFNRLSDGIQDQRETADRAIATKISRLNTLLSQTHTLNQQISAAINLGRETAPLEDMRQTVVDEIAELVPVRQVTRERGGIALYTTGGAIILDDTPVEIGFTQTNVIMPHMTEAGGLLSGLTVNGMTISTDPDVGPLRGGSLAAEFAIRDQLAPAAQAELDPLARDLVERFQGTAVDPTLTATDAGLFTDDGSAFDPTDEVGLSGRLSLNALVSESGSGDFWRLRDGLGAAAAGNVGNAQLLLGLGAALRDTRTVASGQNAGSDQNAAALQGSFLTLLASDRLASDQSVSFAANHLASLQAQEFETGVDTDQEMQQLLLIEQNYAANAKMIETINGLIDTLMRI